MLIQDCHQQVLFLNKVPLPVLEESISIFRDNIFNMSQRKQIPYLIYQVLERELLLEDSGLTTEAKEEGLPER